MGGDFAPRSVVMGAVEAARVDKISCFLVGDSSFLTELISELGAKDLIENKKIRIIAAECAISMDEKPSVALRKQDSSMRIACDLVASGDACGVFSAGNSGAMMAIALLRIGRLEGVIRPAIATLMPSESGSCVVLDVGANIDCSPQMLQQFAAFGSAFAKTILGIVNPRVGVISNGEEDSKGTDLTREAVSLLRQSTLNCVGHCEGRDVFNGVVDVAVCDGFTGNVLLKTAEGTARFVSKSLRKHIKNSNPVSRFGAFLLSGVFKEFRKLVDPREYGAAPLLGLKAPVFIGHGNSDAYAVRRAIQLVDRSAENDLSAQILQAIRNSDPR